MKIQNKTFVRALSMTALVGCAVLAAVPSFGENPAAVQHVEQQLAASNARHVYIMTDKPLYKPGESIWFKSWQTFRGVPAQGQEGATFELVDPRGSVVMRKSVQAVGGMATNDFIIPPQMVGGEYKLQVIYDKGATHARSIVISTYQPPRIKKTLDLLREAYGPGDRVEATVKLHRATGEPLANHTITALVNLDGQELHRLTLKTNRRGVALVAFDLPDAIAVGDSVLTVVVDEGGLIESIQRRVPILTGKVRMELFPEGGDLVTGLPGRVYVRARDLSGEPVDVAGVVVDDTGATVARFETAHKGKGRFELVPERHRNYSVKLTRPHGVRQVFDLPAAQLQGCALRAVDDLADDAPVKTRPVKVAVRCTQAQDMTVVGVLRERLVSHASARVTADKDTVMSLAMPDSAQGAVRVTLHQADGRPVAERLVYRGRTRGLTVKVQADKETYNPRDKVELTVQVADASGQPVQGSFAMAVVDDTVLSFADDRSAHLVSRLFLEAEMPGQTIKDPNFYFGDDPLAPQALDLLLGTSGWRRFQ